MTRTKRAILGLLLLELMLAGFWIYLVWLDPGNVEFQSRVGEAMGLAMGGLLGFFGVLLFIVARRGRKLSQ